MVVALAPHASADPNNPTKAERDRAHQLFEKSKPLQDAGDCKQAVSLLKQAWSLHRSPDIAANLGACEGKLGEYPDAATHLAFADAHLMASATKAQREKVAAALALMKKQVGEVGVSVHPDGAQISVDGKVVGTAPLAAPLFLSPGDHQLAATADGYGEVGRIVTAKKGERTEVEVKLLWQGKSPGGTGGATAGAGGAASGTDGATNGSSGNSGAGGSTQARERSMVPVYVAGGVAVVGLGAALGFELARSSNRDDAQTALNDLGPQGCAAGTPFTAECAGIHDSNVAAHRDADLRNVSLGVAGAALVFGAAYLLWPHAQNESATRRVSISVTPVVSRARGLSLAGSF
ncbi:MAG: PEGA domain-containing protein [Myxococcales bacterium]|nr:PEGA domain-containing protein [Myxococcales bacterium]